MFQQRIHVMLQLGRSNADLESSENQVQYLGPNQRGDAVFLGRFTDKVLVMKANTVQNAEFHFVVEYWTQFRGIYLLCPDFTVILKTLMAFHYPRGELAVYRSKRPHVQFLLRLNIIIAQRGLIEILLGRVYKSVSAMFTRP